MSSPTAKHPPLISPQDLAARIGQRHLRVVDLRHDLMKPGAGSAAWQSGHIPGPGHPLALSHPFPRRPTTKAETRAAAVINEEKQVRVIWSQR